MIVGGVIMGIGFHHGRFLPGEPVLRQSQLVSSTALYSPLASTWVFSFSRKLTRCSVDFYDSGDLGNMTITDAFGIPAAWVALAFTVVALAAFWGTMLIEKRVRKNRSEYKF